VQQKQTVLDDIKEVKGYILGVIGFAVAVSGFCTAIFHWQPEKITAVTAVAATVAISLAVLIQRAENRNIKRLETHQIDANKNWEEITVTLNDIKNLTIENQRSTLRLEMNSYIRNDPANHDTILAYGQKYFIDLNGDWKETDIFLNWAESETKKGRPVHVPSELLTNVQTKRLNETK